MKRLEDFKEITEAEVGRETTSPKIHLSKYLNKYPVSNNMLLSVITTLFRREMHTVDEWKSLIAAELCREYRR